MPLLERDNRFRRNHHALARAGVASLLRLPLLDLKDPEIADGELMSTCEFPPFCVRITCETKANMGLFEAV